MASIDIKPYEPERDFERVLTMWHGAMDPVFRLDHEVAQRVFSVPHADSYTAWHRGELAGFASVQYRASNAEIHSFFVEESLQRQGIGTTLHQRIITQAKEHGITRLQLGGGDPHLFPGVPIQAHPALHFFRSQGWDYTETSLDMVQSLRNYSVSPHVYEVIKPLHISLELYTSDRRSHLLTFMEQEFPSWVEHYVRILAFGDTQDCLLALDKRQNVVAALLLYGPWSHPSRRDTVWQAVFGQALGALGAVITASTHRRLGIGSALVGHATEILKARGASHSFIGWTWADTFYRKLRYEVWQTYKMSWRDC